MNKADTAQIAKIALDAVSSPGSTKNLIAAVAWVDSRCLVC
jgi:hypothetical protein